MGDAVSPIEWAVRMTLLAGGGGVNNKNQSNVDEPNNIIEQ